MASVNLDSIVDLLRRRAVERESDAGYTFLADGEAAATHLTFAEMDGRARAIGALLQQAASPGDRALLLFPPGSEFISAFFGCLYAGVIAVPAYPPRAAKSQERLFSIARDCRPRVVLTTAAVRARAERLAEHLPELRAAVWQTTDDLPAEQAGEWAPPALSPESLAFLQYTSGSTATPKGVMVSHGNLLHNEEIIRQAFRQSADSVIVGWLPLYHDMGLIGNVLQPLYVGARCILMSPLAFLQRPLRWLEAISRYRATTSGGPNFAYDLCVRKIGEEERQGLDLGSWQVAFNGAEPIRADTLDRFAAAFEPHGFDRRAFFPCYGLAEATLFVTGGPGGREPRVERFEGAALEQGRVVPGDGASARPLVSSGRTWEGHELRIVDAETGQPCPPGQVGEIWVQGPSVARGYWNLAEETERSFHAAAADGSGPWLRTGDLGFRLGDELFVTGRAKDLIILRGRNLYPQDLELSAERSHPALRPGCGAAFSLDVADEERLVVVHELERGAEEAAREAAAAIRGALAEEHEVQAYEVLLLKHDSVPKTSSGKIQRHLCRKRYLAGELEVIDRSRAEGDPDVAAVDVAVEEGGEDTPWRELAPGLRRRWLERYLGRELSRLFGRLAAGIDPEQPLTRLGLDSLAAVELQHAVETGLGLSVGLAELLEGASLRQLAESLEQRSLSGSEPKHDAPLAALPDALRDAWRKSSAGYPLTHNQRALWFLQRLQPQSTAYSIVAAAEVEPALDTAVLRRALDLLAERHEALRLGFAESEGGPVQRAVPGRTVELAEVDASGWSAAWLAARLDEIAHRPFDLERDPLLRLTVFQGAPCVVLLAAHHVILDLWSLALLVRDLGDIYTRLLQGEEPPAGAPGLRFTDYVLWQEQRLAGERGEALWAYWREKLAGELPMADLPADRPRPPVQSFAGGARSRWLDRGFLARLQETAGAHRATLYTLLLAAFQALLHRLGGRDDLLVGSPTAGREGAGTAGLVGLFVNSVVLRSHASAASTFERFLAATRQTALEAFAHQDYPFPLLVERLEPQRHPGASPLFQVMFALERSHLSGIGDLAAFALGEAGARLEVGRLQLRSRRLEHRAAQFDLELIAAEGRPGLGLALSFSTDLFDATTAERILGGFEALLRGAVEDPGRRIADLPLLTAAERHQLLLDWNDTAAALDDRRSFPVLFEEQVRRRPDAPAVSCAGRELTYAELDVLANRVARGLLGAGLGREDRVALWAERGIEFLAAMIGIFKAGGAYLPLDPRQPARRLVQMVRSSGAAVVLTSAERHGAAAAALAEAGGSPAPAVLPLAGLTGDAGEGGDLPEGPLPGQLAYVLFTSGSTGLPKAAMIEHRSLLNHLWSKTVHPPLTSADRVAQTAAATFDISIWQFLAPLLVGGSVHVVPDEVAGDPPLLLAELARQRITVLETVPALLWSLVQESEAGPAPDLSSLRWLIPTGEALPPELCRRWFARFPGIPLLNAYGPTECADDVSVHPLHTPPPGSASRTPIGRPVENLRLYVLDRELAPVPIGVPGELFVAGAGVGRGYFGDPARTAAVFIPDPHDQAGGGRLYRTGDVGLRRPDGLLDFLGRGDHQIKVRGFRIELGEIEAALRAHPGVAQAVVVAYPDPRGDKRLAAFWTAEPGASATAGELRLLLRQSLPDAMLPAAYVQLAAMPLAASGKIDRRALPEPDWSGPAERPAAAISVRDEFVEMIAGVFARVLGKEQAGPEDDFFELGGHSLLATQVTARLRQELGVELPLQALFEAPTPAGVAVRVRSLLESSQPGDAPPPLRPSPRGPDLPLSFAQQRLWFLHELDPASPSYNMPGAVRLQGRLRLEALAASLEAVADRHEALRTVFHSAEGIPRQVILPRAEVRLPLVDLAGLPEAARESLAWKLAAAESRRPFDLSRGPLFRAGMLRLGEDDHLLLFTLHHIVSDGWSQGVLVRDMSAFYEAFLQGKSADLPPLPVQYADFALWQREWLQGERVAAQIAYWRAQLGHLGGEHADGGYVALEMPLDRPRPPRRTDSGARRAFAVPAGPALELARLSRGQGGTLFMGLVSLVAACLHRYSGQERIHVGSPVANRRMAELEGLIGFFVNTLVLRADFGDAPSLATLLDRMRRTALEAYAHQDVPFERLVEELQPERDLSRSPLFQAMFVLQNAPAPRLELPGLRLAVSEVDNGTAKLELTLSLEETGDGLLGWIEHNTDLFDGTTAERFGTHFGNLLAAAAASPETPLSELPLLDESGRFQLLAEWNDTRVEIPREALVHRLVAAQAERTPDAVAVSGGGIDLTYRELIRRSGVLARTLRAAGVAPDVPVGIFADRSCEMVVGVLAILEAGGAYLPLDPLYPRERLAALLEDSQAAVVLAQEHLIAALPPLPLRIVPLGADAPDEAGIGETPGAAPLPENVAYVLFTSGSTGRPKGVQVPHRALVSLLTGLAGSPMALGGRTLLSVTTLAFDIASVEIFLPLATGGRVVLADRETVLDGARLAAAAERVRAGLLQATPATWRMLAEAGWNGKADLTAITTGEAAPRDLAEWLRARVGVLWNLYGPTETTVFSSFQRVGARDGSVPIGRPVANTTLLILDRALAPVPLGVVGELYIGGAGVARGYAGRPELTAERFVPDPLGAEPGGRLYRTGDLCRHLPDGTIEYLGRADHQVKLRGFRIELPEIEAVLAFHPAVEQAVVAVRETAGDRRLVAWFVASGPEAPGPGELRDLLRRHLPDYMVPSHYVRLDAMPLTANGKVDRRALPDPGLEPGEARPSAAPRSAAEEILAEILARVLGREQLGADDNFFELGGHSLLATRVMSRVNTTFGVDLPLRSLFETPTVAGLAQSIATARQARPQPPLRRIPRDAGAPLAVSFAQEQLWLMEQLAPGSAVYNVSQALRFTGPLAAAALESSLVEVIRRHEALRTRITTLQGRPVQVIDPEPRFSLPRIDLSGVAPAVRESEVVRLAQAEARRPFRLAREPLVRGLLLLLGADAHALLLAMHHIISDDWSVGLLVHEVSELYQASLAGRPALLPELPYQYADYAQWQRDWMQGEVLEEELRHWGRRLGTDLPVLDLPTDRPRPPRQSMQGSVEPFAVPEPLANALRQIGRDEGATLFMVLLAGFAAVLGHGAGQTDLVVGTPVAGRTRPEIEPLIGFFVNLLPLRLDLSGRPAYRDLIARAREVALDAYGHQGIPFEKLVEAFQTRRDPSRPAIRQVALSVQESSMRPIALGEGLRIEPIATDPGVSRLDLTLFLGHAGEGLAGYCEYDSALFDRTTICRLLDFLRLALEDMAVDPGRRLLSLPPLIERTADLAAETAAAPETNLTPGQLLFWFAPKLQPGVQLYFDRATTTFSMQGELDELCFDRAFRRLVELCDTLRTRIAERGGIPQRVAGAVPPDALEHVDLSGEPDPEAALESWLSERMQRPFDLGERLFDSALLRMGRERFVWFFDIHHVGADAGSLQNLAANLSHLYDLARQDRLDEGLPLPSYDEYAAEEIRYSASESYQADRRYWEGKLARSAGTNLFYRRTGTPFTTRTERISFDLGREESDRVRKLVSQGGLFSPAVVFVSALFALLYRVHGDSRLRIGTSFSNRPHRFRDVVGLMMNTCPLQVEVGDDETFRSLLRRVQGELVETSRHQRYPVRNPVGERAYNVYINYQTQSYRELCGLPVRFDLLSTDHSNDHLNVQVSDFTASGSFRIDLDFNFTAFAGPERVRTAGHFRNLLAALLDGPDGYLANAPMLSPEELQQIASPDGRAAEAFGDSFADLFAAQVARTPEACAASFRGERITYRELAEKADGLARRLHAAGAGPEVPVALLGARNLDFLAALLAIVRTGGVYLPLDPHHPPQRLRRILETCGAPLILASAPTERLAREVQALLPAGRRPEILPLEAPAGDARVALPPSRPDGLAYILFTSGSTGTPKGVMVAWQGALNHLHAKVAELGLTAADVVAQNASQSFDISVWQFLAALLVGGRVHIVDEETALDAAKLLRETAAEGVTVLEIVPSLLAVLLDTAARRPVELPRLRWLVPTGEALPAELCRRWFALYPGVPLLNAYGPTECSDDVTHHPILEAAGAADLGTTPIGRPLPGVRIHVVDRHLGLLPVGVPGELCVGGICVGRGYLREPDRTADAFRPDPFAGEPGARLYRTGDLGRRLEDGTFEFLGRIDHQVKVRGFRIELGEIEAALLSFPGLREAVVLAREDRPTDRRLVAYYVPEPGWGPTAAQLRGFLSSKLPEYMVPAAFVALESMPLTPNGKVDRRALPLPDPAQDSGRTAAAVPSSPLESLIASICSQVLRVEPIGVHDNFFELGGNSLLATQVIAQIQEILPIEIDLRHLFEAPTVSKLAAVIDTRRSDLGEQERTLLAEILADYEQMTGGTPPS